MPLASLTFFSLPPLSGSENGTAFANGCLGDEAKTGAGDVILWYRRHRDFFFASILFFSSRKKVGKEPLHFMPWVAVVRSLDFLMSEPGTDELQIGGACSSVDGLWLQLKTPREKTRKHVMRN